MSEENSEEATKNSSYFQRSHRSNGLGTAESIRGDTPEV